MTRDKSARSAYSVELLKALTASASAMNGTILLFWQSQVVLASAVENAVMGNRWKNDNVFLPIVRLLFIQVVDLLALPQRPSKFFFSDKSMLVRVPSYISKMMITTNADQNIAITGKAATAFPVGIPRSRMDNTHYSTG